MLMSSYRCIPSNAADIEADASSSVLFFCTELKASITSPSSQSSNSSIPTPHSSPAFTYHIAEHDLEK